MTHKATGAGGHVAEGERLKRLGMGRIQRNHGLARLGCAAGPPQELHALAARFRPGQEDVVPAVGGALDLAADHCWPERTCSGLIFNVRIKD
jgi:hypothetical protein